MTFHISGFADEITPHFKDQLIALQTMGISYISLRGINGTNIFDYDVNDIKTNILPLLEEYNIKVSSIGSPIGKVDITDEAAVLNQFSKMKNLIEICQVLKTKYIRMFSYYNAYNHSELVLKHINTLVSYVEDTDIILLHENEKEIFGDTAERCLFLANNIHSKQFKLIYDPANFVQVDEDPLYAFDILKPYIIYLHVKDAKASDHSNVLIGTGDGKMKEIVHRCIDKKDVLFMTLEPHLVPFSGLELLENTEITLPPSTRGAYQAFHASYKTLLTMIK